ncbi:MAG: hypothetical protein VX938_03775 [Myxococcota bacterium]|nr:hypothetical protein [Myxococcota bacterium]
MHWTARILGLVTSLGLLCATAWALMPPHVTKTNITDGVLKGHHLVITGYSLSYTDVPKELSLTYAKDKKALSWKHSMKCTEEGKCDEDSPPGSCQLRCELTVSLSGVKDGDSLRLKYLDLNQLFQVKAK